ncbi:hypothetical protein DVG78_29090 [Runella aurantiaca]|uniref:Uncharacterized protein n=1 Tax=Runella aurantiaca TaxID=2282308 RepID=A0A369I5C6_9BACT|nr:hypothetical protein DVG78_29090 [Runella aurantiaca]
MGNRLLTNLPSFFLLFGFALGLKHRTAGLFLGDHLLVVLKKGIPAAARRSQMGDRPAYGRKKSKYLGNSHRGMSRA